HRDLKPANVLFRDERTLAIIDFGVAKAIGPNAELTDQLSLKGTPYYMSPEVIRGQEIDTRADLYSLGVLLFEMLAGRRPYNARPLANLLRAHLEQPIPGLPPHVATMQPLVNGLLAKDPDDRFQTIGELLVALDGHDTRIF
ncbi:MAG: serine/threonine protein kinase, partial [Gammaproteobacteria bacterium]|nr:serine/threonine protein kinase [Gammaproteobacteria bacterium]